VSKKHQHPLPAPPSRAAAHKQNGLRAFRQNKFTEALRHWQQLDLTAEPALRVPLAEAYFRRALTAPDLAARLNDLTRAIEMTPHDGRLWYHQGLAYQRADRAPDAIAAYERARELGETRAARMLMLVRLEHDPQQPIDGLPEADRAALQPVSALLRGDPSAVLSRSPAPNESPAMFNLWRGLALFAQGDLARACEALAPRGKSLRSGAEAVRATYHGLALWHAERGDRAGALNEWQAAVTRTSAPRLQAIVATQRLQHIRVLIDRQQWAAALKEIEAALALAPDQTDLQIAQLIVSHRLAQDAVAQRRWPAAIERWQAMIAILEKQPQLGLLTPLFYNLALTYEHNEQWAAAAEEWDRLRGKLPPRPSAKSQAALQLPLPVPEFRAWLRKHVLDCYKHSGDLDGAITNYRALIKSAPDDLDLRYEFAQALLSNAQDTAARNELQRILQKDERHTAARLLLVEIQLEHGEMDDAEQNARLAFEHDPNNPQARQAISDVLAEQGHSWFNSEHYVQAKKLYEEALTITPNQAMLLVWLGNTALALQHRADGERYFAAALSKATDLHDYVAVFRCWADRGDQAAARSIIARAEAAGFATSHFFVDLAGICFERSQPFRPIPFFMAAKKMPDDAWSQFGRELVQRAEAAATDPVVALREIINLLKQRQPELALEYTRRLIKLTPDDPLAWLMQATIQMFAGQTQQAKDAARQAANLARKQNNPALLRDIEELRQHLNNPLAFMLDELFDDDEDDDLDDYDDDDEEWFA
jgi:tetratricopeptide (TPR) repeat protein